MNEAMISIQIQFQIQILQLNSEMLWNASNGFQQSGLALWMSCSAKLLHSAVCFGFANGVDFVIASGSPARDLAVLSLEIEFFS